MMHEDFKVVRPSISRNNPTAKYNVKKDSSHSPSPVVCITSRPKLVIDKNKKTDGAFICVRPKLVQKKKSSGESHEVPVILAEVKDDRVLVIFEESGDWKESWILSTDSIIIRDGMRVTDILTMKIGSFGMMVLDGKLSSSPLLVWFGLPVPNVRGEVGDLIRRQDGRIFVNLPVPAAARKPNLVMFHGDLGRYSQVEVGSQVCVWAWSRKVGVDGRFKEGAALVVVRT